MKENQAKLLFLACALLLCCSTALIGYAEQNFPQRIISLGPSITEELYLLKVQDRLIACTLYCKKPKDAENKEKVGTAVEVSLEKIVGLKPDLVLATSLTNPKVIEKLKNLEIKVVNFSVAKSFTQICEQFLELGRIIGKEKEAKEIVHKAGTKVNAMKKKLGNLPKLKIFVQIGARPLFAVTKDSFINDFIEFAGGVNIAYDSKSGLYSREKVIKDNPDVIIITTMGIIGEEEKEIWKRHRVLKAVKNNRIYIVDSDKFCSPTPLNFVEALEEMVRILHPQNE